MALSRSLRRLCVRPPSTSRLGGTHASTSRFFNAPASEFEVFVDGKSVKVPNGATVMYACEQAGVEIPRFCYHDRLSIAGNCRMCLVEVERGPKPVASCAAPAMPGMKIKTNTKMVHTAREGVLEFLLANHPLDCAICDQGGECDLQDQFMMFGGSGGRMREDKRAVQDKDIGPLVHTVMNRCIHCTRCVRFADEVAGVDDLGCTGRGTATEIGTYVNKYFDSELSGNLVDLCPVGALTSKPYAFTARAWELKHTESIDVLDAVGSNITIDTRGLEVMRVKPRLNEDVNEEWISDKTRFSVDGLKRQRLDTPMIRGPGGKIEPCTWPDAFEAVAEKLSQVRGAEMRAIAGDLVDCEGLVAVKDLFNRLGSNNLECSQIGVDMPCDLRSQYLFNTGIPEVESADTLLLVGTNPRMEAAVLNSRIRKSHLHGNLQIAAIGPEADLHYPVEWLGDTSDILIQIAEGRHPYCTTLASSDRPMIVVGLSALRGEPGQATLAALDVLSKNTALVSEEWNGINTLQTAASANGALDVGFVPSVRSAKTRAKFVYLLGADEVDPSTIPEDAFVVYQGSHGDKGAELADLILPSTTYAEKSGTYVNLDGRVQRTHASVTRLQGARDDWQIIRAISEIVGSRLPYDTLEQLRERLGEIAPHLLNVDKRERPSYQQPDASFARMPARWKREKLQPLFDNFYMTDAITRSSPTMARCAAMLESSRNSYVEQPPYAGPPPDLDAARIFPQGAPPLPPQQKMQSQSM